jgi:hypothetical protein
MTSEDNNDTDKISIKLSDVCNFVMSGYNLAQFKLVFASIIPNTPDFSRMVLLRLASNSLVQ